MRATVSTAGWTIDALDDVVAVEEGSPGEAQEVRQPGVDEDFVHRLRIVHVAEEGAETADPAGVQTARELSDGILLEQGSGLRVVAVRATRAGRNTAHHSTWSEDSSTSTWSCPGKSQVSVPGVSAMRRSPRR